MARFTAQQFIEQNICEPKYRDVCFFLSNMLNEIPKLEMFISIKTPSTIEVYFHKQLLKLTFLQIEDMIDGFSFESLMAASYQYFITETKTFAVPVTEISIDQLTTILSGLVHVDEHIDMFVLKRKLFPALCA